MKLPAQQVAEKGSLGSTPPPSAAKAVVIPGQFTYGLKAVPFRKPNLSATCKGAFIPRCYVRAEARCGAITMGEDKICVLVNRCLRCSGCLL
jgi:hypothetical protein